MSETEEQQNEGRNIKRWITIIGVLLLALLGLYFYLYFFNPSAIPESVPGSSLISDAFEREVNILVVGLDDRESVEKGRVEADSIFIARLNGKQGEIELSAIPPDYKIDGGYIKELGPEQIVTALRDKGIKIDNYFAMSYNGFKKIIDEISGIEIKLDKPLEVPELGLYLKEGKNLLSGKEALNYARWYNYQQNGMERIKRQQKVINGVFVKVTQANTLLNIPKIYRTIVESFKSVQTDLDTEFVTQILEFLRNRDNLEINYEIITSN